VELVARIEKAVADGGDRISQWEQGFLESLKTQAKKQGRLSPKQIEVLERVEKQKCSRAAIIASEGWNSLYSDEKRGIAILAAQYYQQNPPYFAAMANRIMFEPDYIPTEKAYRKMCENKFVLRMLAEMSKAPKFAPGSLVYLRRDACIRDLRYNINRLAYAVDKAPEVVALLVLSVNTTKTPKSAAKGTKEYTVLPVGLGTTWVFEERQLKSRGPSKKRGLKTSTCVEDAAF